MSTPRVDFYILESTAPASRLQFACRLTEKAYNLDNRVYAHLDSQADAESFDELLWTFRQGSFVPHELCASEGASGAPVSIGTGDSRAAGGDLLINLANEAPAFAGDFSRVAEIIGGDEGARQAGRARFKHYRDLGIEPETHKISA